MSTTDVVILLVDDDEVDRQAIQRSFQKAKIANKIVEAKDGVEALEYLRGEGGKELIKRPYLILLDINMPRMNGLEFLTEIRKDPLLATSVVFVLTTSSDDVDRTKAHKNLIAGYILKSECGNDFLKVVNMIDNYWRIVEMPMK